MSDGGDQAYPPTAINPPIPAPYTAFLPEKRENAKNIREAFQKFENFAFGNTGSGGKICISIYWLLCIVLFVYLIVMFVIAKNRIGSWKWVSCDATGTTNNNTKYVGIDEENPEENCGFYIYTGNDTEMIKKFQKGSGDAAEYVPVYIGDILSDESLNTWNINRIVLNWLFVLTAIYAVCVLGIADIGHFEVPDPEIASKKYKVSVSRGQFMIVLLLYVVWSLLCNWWDMKFQSLSKYSDKESRANAIAALIDSDNNLRVVLDKNTDQYRIEWTKTPTASNYGLGGNGGVFLPKQTTRSDDTSDTSGTASFTVRKSNQRQRQQQRQRPVESFMVAFSEGMTEGFRGVMNNQI